MIRACSDAAANITIPRMRVLYHLWLSPCARKVRIVLREKNLDFTLKNEKVWERRPEFLALNPAGDHFSIADITAAAQLSSLDYLGDVPWDAHEPAKEWYARIKSRPSFRPILTDHLPGVPPPAHYADLDF